MNNEYIFHSNDSSKISRAWQFKQEHEVLFEMMNLQSQKKLFLLASVLCLLFICLILIRNTTFQSYAYGIFNTNSSSDDFTARTNASNHAKLSKHEVSSNTTAANVQQHSAENVTLVVIISTAPERRERRERIRKTYWKYCHQNSGVRCFFVTDGNVTNKVSKQLQEENERYNDMVFQPLAGGREFGLRFYHQIRWAFAHFNFEYFLRADDDYFICLRKLIHELKYRPKKNLVWAHFHCDGKDLVWPDEAWMVFTSDIIHRFLSQNETKMLCHPHADQQIALWLNDIPSKLYFHDDRLHHHPPAAQLPQFTNIANVCDKYMGLHGAYGNKMYEYHKVSNDSEKNQVPEMRKFDTYCGSNTFDWSKIGVRYRFEPKLCNERPTWSLGHDSWKGGEAGQWRRRRRR